MNSSPGKNNSAGILFRFQKYDSKAIEGKGRQHLGYKPGAGLHDSRIEFSNRLGVFH